MASQRSRRRRFGLASGVAAGLASLSGATGLWAQPPYPYPYASPSPSASQTQITASMPGAGRTNPVPQGGYPNPYPAMTGNPSYTYPGSVPYPQAYGNGNGNGNVPGGIVPGMSGANPVARGRNVSSPAPPPMPVSMPNAPARQPQNPAYDVRPRVAIPPRDQAAQPTQYATGQGMPAGYGYTTPAVPEAYGSGQAQAQAQPQPQNPGMPIYATRQDPENTPTSSWGSPQMAPGPIPAPAPSPSPQNLGMANPFASPQGGPGGPGGDWSYIFDPKTGTWTPCLLGNGNGMSGMGMGNGMGGGASGGGGANGGNGGGAGLPGGGLSLEGVNPTGAVEAAAAAAAGPFAEFGHHLKDKMFGYHENFAEAPLGSIVRGTIGIMESKAVTGTYTLYRSDFVAGTDKLSPGGAERLNSIATRLNGWLGPVIVEWIPEEPSLAEARKARIVALLQGAGLPVIPERIVVGPSMYPGLDGTHADNAYNHINRRYDTTDMNFNGGPNLSSSSGAGGGGS